MYSKSSSPFGRQSRPKWNLFFHAPTKNKTTIYSPSPYILEHWDTPSKTLLAKLKLTPYQHIIHTILLNFTQFSRITIQGPLQTELTHEILTLCHTHNITLHITPNIPKKFQPIHNQINKILFSHDRNAWKFNNHLLQALCSKFSLPHPTLDCFASFNNHHTPNFITKLNHPNQKIFDFFK